MTSDTQQLWQWTAVLVAVIGLFFIWLGIRDWIRRRRFPIRRVMIPHEL